MKVSLSWLNDYVDVTLDTPELAHELTMAGLEVEGVTDIYDHLENICVGKVLEVAPHPNADRLTLCQVDTGERTVQIVCGAPNVKADMVVPVALPGACMPSGMRIKKSKLRGEVSEGMLCSSKELQFDDDHAGIMSLDPSLTPGRPLAEALSLSDTMLEIGLTPNRPDCLGIIGIAREVAAVQKTKVKYPDADIADKENRINDLTSVKIEDPDHCPRYAARMVEGIKVGPSPKWLQERLNSIGVRPISNIVDITNYIMMETGQPLHAFDFDRLAENRIVVRLAKDGEKFVTLDEKERTLSAETLMICDGEKPVAVGGVMGGANSEIEDGTTRVLIESAYFNPISIRRTAKCLGLNTEASHRFERGVDPEGTVIALNRATMLISELGGGTIVGGLIDEHPKPSILPEIALSVMATNRLLGTGFNSDEISNFLTSIEFAVKSKNDEEMVVVPPSYRVDVERPEDLMEEVARLSGYNNIPTTSPVVRAQTELPGKSLVLRSTVRQLMTGFGFTEVINYSFIHRESCERLMLDEEDPRKSIIDIMNPLTEDHAVMRTSLVPGLLECMNRNIARQEKNLKLFEVGKTFIGKGQDSLPEEIEMLIGIWTGARDVSALHSIGEHCDFFDLKGVVEGLLKGLYANCVAFTRLDGGTCKYLRPGYTAGITVEGRNVGIIGEVAPAVLENYDLKQTAYIFELDLCRLNQLTLKPVQAQLIPKFPAISRDITLIINKGIESQQIRDAVKDMDETLVEDIHLFDVFEGGRISSDKKSLSFRIIYRSPDTTLEDEKANHIHKAISEKLIKAFNADLPG
ncbi:MAG: phenylalanine--tRNA ligase subunit beta [Desulfobacterales bacterium]|nr:phenylalanine--tRNA ligase subunit beta [Desulfobacterales bacterium]